MSTAWRPLPSSIVMIKPRIRLGLAVVAAYAAAILYPFDWTLPRSSTNMARFGPEGLFSIDPPGPGIAHTATTPDWVGEAVRTNRLVIDLRVRPVSPDQVGPARILTLSKDPHFRNLTVGQQGTDLRVRVRTPWHTRNGTPEVRIANVFKGPEWVDIRVNVEPGQLAIAVNDVQRVRQAYPDSPFEDWEPSYRLALGNEFTLDRPWFGDIAKAEVRVGDVVMDYAQPGLLQMPPTFFLSKLDLVPFWGITPRDGIVNFFGFIPLGLLAGIWAARRRGRTVVACGLIALFSVTLESLQLALPERFTSVNDVILNTLGGTLGVLLANRLAKRPAPSAIRSGAS